LRTLVLALLLKIETLTRAALPSHMALAQSTYDDPLATDSAHFWWKHGVGPAQPSISIGLYEKDWLVGRAMVQRRRFRIDASTTVSGGLIFDVVLAPKHRNAANFISLVRAQAEPPDIDIVVHTSNATSQLLYERLLRYPIAFRLAAFGLPVRLRGLIRKLTGRAIPGVDLLTVPWRWALRAAAAICRRLSGLNIEIGMPSESELQRFVPGFTKLVGPHFERNHAFLEWRFQAGPQFNGAVATLRRSGTPCGYIAWRMVSLEGLEFLVLMDLVLDAPLTLGQSLALRLDFIARACRDGADVAFVMMNPDAKLASAICGLPLIRILDQHLPHPTPIFVHSRRHDLDVSSKNSSMHITLADIDYF
jgi:hypothetical protein